MGITKVDKLKIAKFRRFTDITLKFGKNITIIAGQNGTAKSTLLGMLAQPFSFGVIHGEAAGTPDASSYTKNYHRCKLHTHKDLTGKNFMYDCDDVFRLSEVHDFGNAYQYETHLLFSNTSAITLPNHCMLTKSRTRTQSRGRRKRMRFVTGPGASHKSGEGNYPHPVIYLGLNRLWPLAAAKQCTFTGEKIPNVYRNWYMKKYKDILCLDEQTKSAKFMDTAEKRKFLTPDSSDYDGESCSAGQDNLSQILTAILSFRNLKKKLGKRYQGGMLLIDELDAALHAFAQDQLLNLFSEVSQELYLQIVATSHSLRVLEMAFQSGLKRNIEVLYLVCRDGTIDNEKFDSFQEVSNHLRVDPGNTKKKKHQKVSVVFEDKVGERLFKYICGSKLRNYIHTANVNSLGGGHLKNIAEMSRSLPELQDLILIADGDMAKAWTNPPKNLLALPGGSRPETLIYDHLYSMKDRDRFWTRTYTRQVAIIKVNGDKNKGKDKKWVKNWFKNNSQHWGRSSKKAFTSWVQANKPACLKFTKKCLSLLNGRYKGEIPKSVISKTLAPLDDS